MLDPIDTPIAVLAGFARTFGMELPNGERREWLKPIMFSAGLGQIPAVSAKKGAPEAGMWVVKVRKNLSIHTHTPISISIYLYIYLYLNISISTSISISISQR